MGKEGKSGIKSGGAFIDYKGHINEYMIQGVRSFSYELI